jgi:hypothetical protein
MVVSVYTSPDYSQFNLIDYEKKSDVNPGQ